jgi:hypothetical protein
MLAFFVNCDVLVGRRKAQRILQKVQGLVQRIVHSTLFRQVARTTRAKERDTFSWNRCVVMGYLCLGG